MRSPGHRANILNKDYKELGVGYCRKEGTEYTHYWIQMFRGKLRETPKPPLSNSLAVVCNGFACMDI